MEPAQEPVAIGQIALNINAVAGVAAVASDDEEGINTIDYFCDGCGGTVIDFGRWIAAFRHDC